MNLFIYNKKSARKCNNGPKDVKMFFDNIECYFQSLLIDAGKQYIYSISKLYHTNYCWHFLIISFSLLYCFCNIFSYADWKFVRKKSQSCEEKKVIKCWKCIGISKNREIFFVDVGSIKIKLEQFEKNILFLFLYDDTLR